MVEFLFEFVDPKTGHAVVIEDDGRVAYAYLCDSEQQIVGDVWLYNRGAAPVTPEWDRRPTRPLLNPLDFCRTDLEIALPESEDDFTIGWHLDDRSDPRAAIYVRGMLWALAMPAAKPGFCQMAKQDGPLAKVLPATTYAN